MKSLGFNVETVAVGDYLELVPPGFVVGDKMLASIQRSSRSSSMRRCSGYRDALADPSAAFESSLKRMPELSADKQPLQRDVLTATLDYYKPLQGRPVGGTDPDGWVKTQDFLLSIGVIDHKIDPTQYYNNTFVQRASG